MCGIAGAISLSEMSIDTSSAKPMTDKISHRGPDDAGYLFFHTGCRHKNKVSFYQNLTDSKFQKVSPLLPPIENKTLQRELNQHDWDLYLGHRRLSIMDTSPLGHQPMSDLSKNIWLVFNGEIYNFKEIRAELRKKGHSFITQTDTEVIIYAYIEWGIQCIDKFNGMFAFALYDNFRKKLFLVRDRYGIKPLYYTLTKENTVLFASEIKSILEYEKNFFGIDHDAIVEYFTFQNILTDKTLHKNIKLLDAGHYLEINLLASEPDIRKHIFWDFNFSETDSVSDEREYVEELDRLFANAVRRQLVADVEVGSYLSGGIDSGSITSFASRQLPYMKTFTIGFDLTSASGLELGFDEREKSEYMSYLFKTEHYEMVLKSGDMERCLPEFAYHLEEPRVGQSYPNFYAAKLASRFVNVVLSGVGGDELFAGYPWRYINVIPGEGFDTYIDAYFKFWHRLLGEEQVEEIFVPVKDKVQSLNTKEIFLSFFKKFSLPESTENYINHSLYFEAKTFLHGLLVVEDKLSMAHSLETRLPFLDNELVDFAQKIPVRFKIGNLENIINLGNKNDKESVYRTNNGKYILRKAMNKFIPDDIKNAVKKGFSSPDDSWFKGDSIDFVKAKLLNPQARIYQYMDTQKVQALIAEHLNGKQNRRLFIWSLLNFEQWCQVYT